MKRANLFRALTVAGALLIVVGAMFALYMLATEETRNVISVQISDIRSGGNSLAKEITFESLALVPGDECEYDVVLKRDRAQSYGTYILTLDFVEIAESPLKEYARVRILLDDTPVYDELLVTAMDDENLVMTVDFEGRKKADMKIQYYLPLEVGNEAKKATAQFKLVLTATNE